MIRIGREIKCVPYADLFLFNPHDTMFKGVSWWCFSYSSEHLSEGLNKFVIHIMEGGRTYLHIMERGRIDLQIRFGDKFFLSSPFNLIYYLGHFLFKITKHIFFEFFFFFFELPKSPICSTISCY